MSRLPSTCSRMEAQHLAVHRGVDMAFEIILVHDIAGILAHPRHVECVLFLVKTGPANIAVRAMTAPYAPSFSARKAWLRWMLSLSDPWEVSCSTTITPACAASTAAGSRPSPAAGARHPASPRSAIVVARSLAWARDAAAVVSGMATASCPPATIPPGSISKADVIGAGAFG